MTTAAYGIWRPRAVLGSVLAWAVLQAQGYIAGQSTLMQLQSRSVQVYRGWSAWTTWSQCSRTCGGGVSMRTRVCRTRISYGTESYPHQCLGETTEYTLCQTELCPPYTTDFRTHQCAIHNGLQVGGRVVPHWIPFLGGSNPCELICRAGQFNFHYTFGKVRDGTDCSNEGVCVNGRCMVVGCDGRIGGTTVETDICGVCGGKNATCVHVEDTYRGQPSRSRSPQDRSYDYHQVAVIPAGATHIKVTDSSSSYLALMDHQGTFVVNGNWRVEQPGVYPASGSLVTYARTWDSRESLVVPGPTFQDLIVLVLVLGTGTPPEIRYEYWLPRERLPEARRGQHSSSSTTVSQDSQSTVPSAQSPPTRGRYEPVQLGRAGVAEVLESDYYSYRSVNRSVEPRTMYTVSQHPHELLADAKIVLQPNVVRAAHHQVAPAEEDKETLIEATHGRPKQGKSRDATFRREPFHDRRKVLIRSNELSRDRNAVTGYPAPKPVNGGFLRNHVPVPRSQTDHRTRSRTRQRQPPERSEANVEEPRRKGSCPPCPRVKQQAKHYCTSDFVLRVVVLSREVVANHSRLELQVVQSYKNSVHILPTEYLWTRGDCPCPRLRRGREYIVMGRAVLSGSRNEIRLTVDSDSFVRRYTQQRSRAVMKLRRDQDRICRNRIS